MQCPQPHDQPRHAGLRPGQIKREHQEKIEPSSYSCTNAVTLGYDESKLLARFLWDVFAGWDAIAGYRKEDIVKKMIDAI